MVSLFRLYSPLFWAIFILLSAQTVPAVAGTSPATAGYTTDSYGKLRHFLLGKIGSAKAKIVVASTFLDDGEFVMALYMAQYRGVAVTVILGEKRIRHYTSRLRYLLRQEVPVFSFRVGQLSRENWVLVDDSLWSLSVPLSTVVDAVSYRADLVVGGERKRLLQGFDKLMKRPKRPRLEQLPRVGKARRYRGPTYYNFVEDGDAYNYDRRRSKKTTGSMPKRLPKETIFQKKQSQSDDDMIKPAG